MLIKLEFHFISGTPFKKLLMSLSSPLHRCSPGQAEECRCFTSRSQSEKLNLHVWSCLSVASKHPSSKLFYCSNAGSLITCHYHDLKLSRVISPYEYKPKIVDCAYVTPNSSVTRWNETSWDYQSCKCKKPNPLHMCYSEDLISCSSEVEKWYNTKHRAHTKIHG